MTTSPPTNAVLRFRGQPASRRSTELTAAATAITICALAVAGLVSTPIAFLAVGAGAGYSLSGSV